MAQKVGEYGHKFTMAFDGIETPKNHQLGTTKRFSRRFAKKPLGVTAKNGALHSGMKMSLSHRCGKLLGRCEHHINVSKGRTLFDIGPKTPRAQTMASKTYHSGPRKASDPSEKEGLWASVSDHHIGARL
jgi:hypothetical protein